VSPADQVAHLAALSTRHETPCGTGHMVWRVWGADAAKQPIVLLHGGSGSWTHWIRQIRAFAARYEVWAVDLPGLGDSDMPDAPLTPETCGRVVAEGLYRLFPDERRPHVVSFSFGAHVGTYAAAELGKRLGSFTLCGSAALGLTHARYDFGKEHARMTDAERAAVHRANLAVLMIADPSRIDDLAVHCQAENIARSRFRSRPFATTDEIARTLPRVTAPVAAVWGAKDQICIPDVESRHRVLRSLKPDLLWRSIADAGHWVMYEQPDAYNASLADVLTTIEKGSRGRAPGVDA
jgi:2-hydroxy-6-oxonona-2,4-dienedioate hydrolase